MLERRGQCSRFCENRGKGRKPVGRPKLPQFFALRVRYGILIDFLLDTCLRNDILNLMSVSLIK